MEDRNESRKMMKNLMLELVNGMIETGAPGAKAMKYSIENNDLELKIMKHLELHSDLGKIADSFFEQINTLYKEFIKEYIDE